MKRMAVALSLGVLMLWSAPVQAELYTIDLSSLGGRDFELLLALYDNNYLDAEGNLHTGDSWVYLDNVALDSVVQDSFDAGLGEFDASLNPDSVNVEGGRLRIDEDPVWYPTYAFRDYFSPTGNILTFDLEAVLSPVEGLMGMDQFVISIVDPETLEPLFIGLTPGLPGDILVADAAGGVQVDEHPTVVPAPAALLLGLLGFGAGGFGLWRGRTHLV